MNSISTKWGGVTGTIIVHVLVVLLLFLFAFTTPLPLPGSGEIMINFGTDLEGSGYQEPKKEIIQETTQKKQEVKDNAKEEPLTQDNEEAPAVTKKKKETKKEAVKTPADKTQQQVTDTKKEETKEVNKKALFPGQKTDGGQTGEGETGNPGNQGNEEGSPDSNNRTGSNGSGLGDGIGFDLGGRSALSLPKPDYSKQKSGTVVVQVTVDKQGNVTKAVPGFKGSTTLDNDLLKAAEKAALQAKFDVSKNAPAYQVGTITYVFKLK